MVTRHTVRTGREFALNLPMALFFILLPLLLLFAWIFPLLASCCLIQSCSDTAPLLGHRSLTHRLPTEQIHLLDSSKPKSSAMEVLSSSCLAGLTQHLCFYKAQTTTSTTPVRLCTHGMFGPAPPRILDLHTRGCLRPAAPEQVPNAAGSAGRGAPAHPGHQGRGMLAGTAPASQLASSSCCAQHTWELWVCSGNRPEANPDRDPVDFTDPIPLSPVNARVCSSGSRH